MPKNKTNRPQGWRELVAGLDLEIDRQLAKAPVASGAANDASYVPVDGDDFYRVCRDGERTQRLTRTAGSLIAGGLSVPKVTDILLALNRDKNDPPLNEVTVRETVASIARTHDRNHPADDDTDAGSPLFNLQAASVLRFLAQEAPERQWVLENCIPLGKAGVLVAPGGTGKSQLVLQLAYDVATGRRKYSPWAPSKAGKVIILSAEDEEDELHRRFLRLAHDDVVNPDGGAVVQRLGENLFIVPRVAEDNLLTRGQPGAVVQTALIHRILNSIQGVNDVSLIVLDPLSRFRGGNENSAEDTTRCVEALELLAKLSGAAVLVAHHTNKASATGSEPNQNASRGSSALVDGLRLVLNLSFASSGGQNGQSRADQLLDLRITKTNYGPLGDAILLRRDPEGRLLPISATDAKEQRQRELMTKVIALINAETSEGRMYSKSTFATKFAGPDSPFHMGQASLKSFISGLCNVGILEVDQGRSKHLRLRKGSP